MFKTKKLIVSMCGILLAVLLFISLTAANKASYAEWDKPKCKINSLARTIKLSLLFLLRLCYN